MVFKTDDDLKDHQRNLSEIAANVAWNHVIPRNAVSGIESAAGAVLGSESKIIASCRAVYPQVSRNLFLLRHTNKLSFLFIFFIAFKHGNNFSLTFSFLLWRNCYFAIMV